MAEQDYFTLLIQRDMRSQMDELKLKCSTCTRQCKKTIEERMECLANLMTIEYLLDHN